MQPIAQVSTPNEYYHYPNKTSGALYHKVSISCVKVLIGIENAQANPKSAIFIRPLFESIKRFYGFKSLCIILLL